VFFIFEMCLNTFSAVFLFSRDLFYIYMYISCRKFNVEFIKLIKTLGHRALLFLNDDKNYIFHTFGDVHSKCVVCILCRAQGIAGNTTCKYLIKLAIFYQFQFGSVLSAVVLTMKLQHSSQRKLST